jgi:DNA (cytosine-5)-methyltransferase 1
VKAAGLRCKRPLELNTLKRLVKGLVRHVFESLTPFIVQVNHGGPEFLGQSLGEMMPAITSKHGFGLAVPSVVGVGGRAGQSPATAGDAPIGTITAKNDRAVATAHIVRCAHGEGKGGKERWGKSSHDVVEPVPTLTASKDFALVGASLLKFYGGVVGQDLQKPCPTITSVDHNAIATAHVVKFRGQSAGHAATEPLPTITSGDGAARPAGAAHALGTAAMYLVRIGQTGGHGTYTMDARKPLTTIVTKQEHCAARVSLIPLIASTAHSKTTGRGNYVDSPRRPLKTMTASNDKAVLNIVATPIMLQRYGEAPGQQTRSTRVDTPILTITPDNNTGVLAMPTLVKFYGTSQAGAAITGPAPTITAGAGGGHVGLACPYCVKYYGCGVGQELSEPLHTVTTKERFGFVWPELSPIANPGSIGRARQVYKFLWRFRRLVTYPANVTFHHDGHFVTVNLAGQEYLITDIGLRMLQPRELAAAQFTPEIARDYILPKKASAAVAKIGNSVCPPVVAALVRSNCVFMRPARRKARAA